MQVVRDWGGRVMMKEWRNWKLGIRVEKRVRLRVVGVSDEEQHTLCLEFVVRSDWLPHTTLTPFHSQALAGF